MAKDEEANLAFGCGTAVHKSEFSSIVPQVRSRPVAVFSSTAVHREFFPSPTLTPPPICIRHLKHTVPTLLGTTNAISSGSSCPGAHYIFIVDICPYRKTSRGAARLRGRQSRPLLTRTCHSLSSAAVRPGAEIHGAGVARRRETFKSTFEGGRVPFHASIDVT